MEDLFNILSEGKAHVRVEMDAADLKAFSDELIRRAKDELGSMVEAARKERMLSKAEVKELFGVCDATLWHWDRKASSNPSRPATRCFIPSTKCARRLDNATKSYELMEKNILFPLGIFPVPVRHIVESLQKYEHYQVDFTAVSFFHCICSRYGQYLVSPVS